MDTGTPMDDLQMTKLCADALGPTGSARMVARRGFQHMNKDKAMP